MPYENSSAHLKPMAVIYMVSGALRKIDQRLMDHGERVAYLACRLCECGNLELDPEKLFLLSVFHDIGAYKTDEIDRMMEFETHDVWNHAIYSYLFLKHMSPLADSAEAVLYHHTPWKELQKAPTRYAEYAALIQLADRIDIAATLEEKSPAIRSMIENEEQRFKPEHVALFEQCIANGRFFEELDAGLYRRKNAERCAKFYSSAEEVMAYLKMTVYAIDFRSEFTVTHTINTIFISVNIAEHFGLSLEEREKIYIGALLHDVGKVAIPAEILEFPGRLSQEKMQIMRTHVAQTELLIRGVVPDEICEIAVRHHEKLDGSGYPHGLADADLNLSQRIVAVADIVSALSSRRSYKEPFPKEKTLRILREMSGKKLDEKVCGYVHDNYDEIMACTNRERRQVIDQYQQMMEEFAVLRQAFLKNAGEAETLNPLPAPELL